MASFPDSSENMVEWIHHGLVPCMLEKQGRPGGYIDGYVW